MSKNKQPRDGNGKFTKTIKVTDKYGNAAYFTPEEMRGFKLPEKNPDCEPATKGYVKSLLRKTRDHTHRSETDGLPIMLSTIGGWFFTVICGACIVSNNGISREFGDKYFVPFLLFSIALTIIFYELGKIDICEVKENYNVPIELQKYTPPHRDECEEE